MVAKARAVLEADTRGMDRALTQSEKRWASWRGNAVKASAAVGVALLAGSKVAIDAASNLNEEVDKSRVVFGNHAEAMEKWAGTADAAFGASKRQALEFAGVFGSMLRPMGFTEKAAGGMSKALVQLGGDMASFNNANIEDTLQSLRSGLSGETEPLRKFGVFLNEDRIAAEALGAGLVKASVDMGKVKDATERVSLASAKAAAAKKKYGEGTEEHRRALLAVSGAERGLAKELDGKIPKLTSAQKAQSAYQIILKDTALQQGNFKDTLESAANQERKLAAETENLQAKLGQGLLPAYKEVLSTASSLVDLMAEHEGATKTTIGVVGGLAGAVLAVSAATKVYSAAMTVATMTTAASAPALMAYRASLWATAAAGAQVTLATKGMAAAQALLMKTPLGLVMAGAALAIGAVALSSDDAADKIREQADAAREAARATADWASQLQSVRDQQTLLAGKKLDVAEARLNLGDARANLKAVRADPGFVKGSAEEQRAMIAVTRARMAHTQALAEERKALREVRDEREKQVFSAVRAASDLSRLAAARSELSRAEREASKIKHYGGTNAERSASKERVAAAESDLARLEAKESEHLRTLRGLRKAGVIDYIRVGDQYRIVAGKTSDAVADVTIAGARRAGRGANGELAKIGQVPLDRGVILKNLVAPFLNIGKDVRDAVGKITIPINAAINFMGIGAGDAFAADGLPPGVSQSLNPFAAIGQRLGLSIPSGGGKRPGGTRTASGGVSDHSKGKAIDLAGSPSAMRKMAQIARRMPNVKQVIYSPLGMSNGGSPFGAIGHPQVEKMHYNHVHVAAFQRGGVVAGGCGCPLCSDAMHAASGGRVPHMPWSGASGDSVPAILEPDEVVVNRSFTRAYPGGPTAFDRDTNGAVPRFAKGGVAGALKGARARADDSLRANIRREAAARRALAVTVRQLAKASKAKRAELAAKRNEQADEVVRLQQTIKDARAAKKSADTDAKNAAAADKAEQLRSSVAGALGGRVFSDELAGMRARGTADLGDDIAAVDSARGTNDARIGMLQGAIGQAVDDETRADLQGQLNDAIKQQIDLDQQRTQLIDQQIEAEKQREEQRQAEMRSSVQRTYALSDAERDLLMAKAEATADTEDDKAVLASEINAWTSKLADLQALRDRGDLTEETRIDLLGQQASATRALTDAQKRQSQLTNEVENQIQERLRSEQAAILGARSRFNSEFASNTFSPSGAPAYTNGPATPTHVAVNQYFTSQPDDPWVWTKKSQYAAESVFGG